MIAIIAERWLSHFLLCILSYQSIIDLTVINVSLALILNWYVGPDPWSSDHLPIISEVQSKPDSRIGNRRVLRLHARDTDWELFRDVMDEKLKLIIDLESTKTMYATFTAIVGEVISSVTSSRYTERREYKGKQSQVLPPWINECDRWFHLRKKALEKFKQTGMGEDFINYKKKCGEMRSRSRIIRTRRIKQDKFRDFCESFRSVLCLEDSQKILIQIQSETPNEYFLDKT